jgi:hypothetical protein
MNLVALSLIVGYLIHNLRTGSFRAKIFSHGYVHTACRCSATLSFEHLTECNEYTAQRRQAFTKTEEPIKSHCGNVLNAS